VSVHPLSCTITESTTRMLTIYDMERILIGTMDGTCSMHEEYTKEYKILVGKILN
jgi:hypothetical protein